MEFTGERFIPEKLKESDDTYQEHIERYKFARNYVGGLTALDASCGVGYGAYILAQTAKKIVAIDISEKAIEYAKIKYSNDNIIFQTMDINKLKFDDNFFDAVVSFETIEHISFQEVFLKEVFRVLKPNGILIISTPNKDVVPETRKLHTTYHVKEFNLEEMLSLLRDFRNKEVYCQKMTYHIRIYRKIKSLYRHLNKNLRDRLLAFAQKKFMLGKHIPILFKILMYEHLYKFKIISSNEKNKYIKPTFYIIVCRK